MDKVYAPADIEHRLYARWEASGLFAPQGDGPGYCIVIPPPNVTGTLHMGHAFQDTIMDALTRYHRMRGEAALWQPGTDHAGIATQMVVERQLEGEGLTRAGLGRDAFGLGAGGAVPVGPLGTAVASVLPVVAGVLLLRVALADQQYV